MARQTSLDIDLVVAAFSENLPFGSLLWECRQPPIWRRSAKAFLKIQPSFGRCYQCQAAADDDGDDDDDDDDDDDGDDDDDDDDEC